MNNQPTNTFGNFYELSCIIFPPALEEMRLFFLASFTIAVCTWHASTLWATDVNIEAVSQSFKPTVKSGAHIPSSPRCARTVALIRYFLLRFSSYRTGILWYSKWYRMPHSSPLPGHITSSTVSSGGSLSGLPEEDLRTEGRNNSGCFPAWLGQCFKHSRYYIVRKLGWGQYASIWLARDRELPFHP